MPLIPAFNKKYLVLCILISPHLSFSQISTVTAIEQAHHELWGKFIDKYGLLNDYVGERPTPFDCRLSRPNAFGWGTPIANSTFFTGLYIMAICNKASNSKLETDKDKARILAQGLLRSALVSDVPGFIARGVSTDGKTHYPNGSNDQTIPWFLGLYYYLKTDIPSEKEREIIKNKLIEIVESLKLNDWRFPSDGMFTGGFRDDLLDNRFLEAPCYLFLLRSMYELTGNHKWLRWYQKAASEKPVSATKSRLEICEEGISYDLNMWGNNRDFLWIYVAKQAALVELAKMEKEESVKTHFLQGIYKNRDFVKPLVDQYIHFSNQDSKTFDYTKWRECYPNWHPQLTIEDAIHVARFLNGNGKINQERKNYERRYMTNPLAGASIIALAGKREDLSLLEKVISHYDYSRINLSEFFYATYAYHLLENSK